MIEKITIDDRELQRALLRFYKTKGPAEVLRAQARLMGINSRLQPFRSEFRLRPARSPPEGRVSGWLIGICAYQLSRLWQRNR